mgnify:CR=1 FL=1
MTKTYEIIDFERRKIGKKQFITKFGGEPDWIKRADWPLSLGWEERKMMFVGQIFLKKDMLGNDKDLMVYIFMTHPEYFEDDFFDPDITEWEGGENAVIVQTFDGECNPIRGDEGPIVFDDKDEHYEYIPILKETVEADFLSDETYHKLSEEQQTKYFNDVDKDKIGGTPAFFRRDEWPEGNWKLLLQVHCNFLPFILRAGAIPTMFVFISEDFKNGGILIQD